jgi:putative spermidine/putrescine transport system substrate-binding protein
LLEDVMIIRLCLVLLFLAVCSAESGVLPEAERDFQAMEQAARGSEVRWHMWGGSAQINQWVDTYVADEMKKRYDITVVRVPMDAPVFVNKLLTEKAAGKAQGTMDLLWINGENFKNAMEAGLLFGPFVERLPNFRSLYDPEKSAHDFGYPVNGFEAPYGRAQFVFEYDTERTPVPPASMSGLAEWIKAHPGRFTYPQPPDFTGSAFLRHVFYATTEGHEQYMMGFDAELYARNAPKTFAWLSDVKPYLWQEGRTYPKDSAALDTLFARGEIDMAMSYHPAHAQMKIIERTYPETVRTFVLKDGAIFNTHFVAIPFNAPNRDGAMVLANFLMSVEAQASKFRPENWGDMPALEMSKLDEAGRRAFAGIDLGEATLDAGALSAVAVPEIPSEYLELLEKDWDAHILGQ